MLWGVLISLWWFAGDGGDGGDGGDNGGGGDDRGDSGGVVGDDGDDGGDNGGRDHLHLNSPQLDVTNSQHRGFYRETWPR